MQSSDADRPDPDSAPGVNSGNGAPRVPSARRLRVLLVTHRDAVERPDRNRPAFIRALATMVDLDLAIWEDAPPGPMKLSSFVDVAIGGPACATDFDVCIFFVRFRLLCRGAALDWGSFRGLRVMYDFDALQNFPVGFAGPYGHPGPYEGSWPSVVRHHQFDVLVCTGREVTNRLRAEGIDAHWVPKGYDAATFTDLGRARHGLCTFGRSWPARRALADRLRREHIPMRDVSGPYASLNERLNEHAGAVVCNMFAAIPFGRFGRRMQRRLPWLARVGPGLEPMAKTFEVAGAGCAPILDRIAELDELGFVAGENCVMYQDFDDLVEQLRGLDDDALIDIGRRAHNLVAGRHTLVHRARELSDLLRRLASERQS